MDSPTNGSRNRPADAIDREMRAHLPQHRFAGSRRHQAFPRSISPWIPRRPVGSAWNPDRPAPPGILLLWRLPCLGHGAFDDVSLHPGASRTTERSQVLAEGTRLNRRQFHRRTASRALRPLVLCVEHRLPLTIGGSATELSVTDNCRCGAVMCATCSPESGSCWSILLSLRNILDPTTNKETASVRARRTEAIMLGIHVGRIGQSIGQRQPRW